MIAYQYKKKVSMGKSQSRHEQLKKLLVDTLAFSKCFVDIKTEIPGFETPDSIFGDEGVIWTPDITAKSEHFNIFEIETAHSLNVKATIEKWTILARHCGQRNGKFWIVVPTASRRKATEKMLLHGIDGGVLGL